MSLFRISSLIAMIAVLAALVGCGGDSADESGGEPLSTSEYEQQVTDVLAPVGPALQKIGESTSQAGTPEEAAEGVGEAEEILGDAVADLDAIEPPEEVADAHDQMITAIEGFEAAAADFREVAEGGDEQEALEAAPDFVAAATEFQTELQDVTTQFQDAGIQLGGSAPQ